MSGAAQAIWLGDTWGMHGDVGWGWMAVMMVGMVVFWAAVIFGAAWLIRGATRSGPGPGEGPLTRETPLEILERRFAEGAISAEDYRARRDVLVGGTTNGAGAEGALVTSGSEGAGR